jgi:hypothetical protein
MLSNVWASLKLDVIGNSRGWREALGDFGKLLGRPGVLTGNYWGVLEYLWGPSGVHGSTREIPGDNCGVPSANRPHGGPWVRAGRNALTRCQMLQRACRARHHAAPTEVPDMRPIRWPSWYICGGSGHYVAPACNDDALNSSNHSCKINFFFRQLKNS